MSDSTRRFWLVQRIKRAPWKEVQAFYERPGVKVKSNPFGYGRLGDYELDYMGAAEFEWGAIPDAMNRLAKAGKKGLTSAVHTFNGEPIEFLWIAKEGDPYDDWCGWAQGRSYTDEFGYEHQRRQPFEGKEPPYTLRFLLGLDEPFGSWTVEDYRDQCQVWWALGENVLWAFKPDDGPSHLELMLASMAEAPVEVRGA